jgi:hypothetical protein
MAPVAQNNFVQGLTWGLGSLVRNFIATKIPKRWIEMDRDG